MYSDILLDHLQHPRNVGELSPPALVAEVVNSACGDRIRLCIALEGERIVAAKMRAYGCVPTLAVASLLTELISNKPVKEALTLESNDLITALQGLPRGKRHAADLAIEVLQTILEEAELAAN